MSRYDGLIIPRSYSEYINKTDAATLLQALQLSGVMDNAPTAQSTKPAKSGGIFAANAVIMADSATLSGVAISAGSVVRVLFTEDLTGSDATTGLQLTYNGNAYAVKVGKNGALADFNAYKVESGVFKYLQAYTTLELMFDGTQFIIIGNPVVLSSADYTIYPDGSIAHPIWNYYKYGTSGYIEFDGVTTKELHCVEGNLIVVKTTVDIIQNFWRSIYLGTYLENKSILGFQSTLPPISANTMLLCIARTLSTGEGYLDAICIL